MSDDFSRTWVDFVDDLDAENMNDLEARQEARVSGSLGGIELGYASSTSTFTTTSTTAGGVDVTGLSVTVTVGTRPIIVKVRADSFHSSAASGGVLYLNQDGTNIGTIAVILSADDDRVSLCNERRLAPAAGSHTYKIRAVNASAGTLGVTAGDGVTNDNSPMAIQVIEV